MDLKRIAIAALLVLGLGHAASAQQPAAARPQADTPQVDVNRLPINLTRINRALRQTSEREERDGLRLRYSIDVYGTAPRINILDPTRDNLLHGPVPYGGPTHQDMLQLVTPQEYRAPAADFSALMRWFQDRSKK
jgi:hypothetical protein